MATDTLREIFGTLRTPLGATYPNKSLQWFRSVRATVAQGSSVVVDQPVIITTDAAGAIDTAVLAGDYLVMVPLSDADRYFRVVVPDAVGPFDISSLIDGQMAEPDSLTQFEALVAKAKAWAAAPEDLVVEDAEYSAKHHAIKAAVSAASAGASAASAGAASAAALLSQGLWPTTAAGIGNGVAGTTSLIAGSGGTDGTFPLAFTGGTQVLAPVGVFVVAGGALVSILITYAGYYSAGTPTLVFTASAGLTGASATAVMAANTDVNEFFAVPSAELNEAVIIYKNIAGVATEQFSMPNSASVPTLIRSAGLPWTSHKMLEAAGSISPTVYMAYSPWIVSTAYEHVVIARAGDRSFLNLFCNTGCSWNVTFDLSTGDVGAFTGTGTMQYLGGGWWKCIATAIATATTSGNVQARPSPAGTYPFTGDATKGLYIDSINLRVAGTTTNLLSSSDPSNVAFTKTSLTATVSTTAETLLAGEVGDNRLDIDTLWDAVNGTETLWQFTEDAGPTLSTRVYRGITPVSTSSYRFVVNAKAGTRNRIGMYGNLSLPFAVSFNLETGIATTHSGTVTTTMTYLINGVWQCEATITATSATYTNIQLWTLDDTSATGITRTGDGASYAYIHSFYGYKDGSTTSMWTGGTNFLTGGWTENGLTLTESAATYLGIYGDVSAFSSDGVSAFSSDGSAALVGMKWTALGDSITIGAQYTGPLASKSNMVLTNAGVSGASLGEGIHSGSLVIYNAIATIPIDSELVTVFAGINDFAANMTPLGTLGDTTTATFYGALYAAVVAIYARASAAKIVFLVPYGGDSRFPNHTLFATNANSNTLTQFQTAVLDVGAALGLPCINVGQESGIGYLTGTANLSDGLHPNATGGALIADYMFDELKRLVRTGYLV